MNVLSQYHPSMVLRNYLARSSGHILWYVILKRGLLISVSTTRGRFRQVPTTTVKRLPVTKPRYSKILARLDTLQSRLDWSRCN
jgi:hypothetical protein